jgi:uncharacterized membrane protein YqjE
MAMHDHTASPNVTPSDDPNPVQSILTHAQRLVRKEFDLLKAEISERIGKAGNAVVMIAIGAVLAFVGLDVLAAFAITGLVALGLEGWVASLIVTLVVFVLAAILIGAGIRTLKNISFVPQDTLDTLERDARVFKETMNHDR